jgi:phosphohistidine phosphatase SixA
MDVTNFDNDAEGATDEEYFAFVAWLSEQTANELQAARGDTEAQKQALCRYYRRGLRANLTAEELIDFLGVSSPSIWEEAGYSEAEADALMQLSDSLTDDDINNVVLP